MKRWEDFLKEEPSKDLTAKTEAKVFAEMAGASGSRRWWLQLASVSVALAALVTGYRLITNDQTEDPEASGFVELADEDLDLETMEDLDVIEILEELEEWNS